MKNRGIRFLEDQGVDFQVVEYIYKKKGGQIAAQAVGWNDAQVVKSLVVKTGPKDYCFTLVPTDRDLSVKKLARMIGAKTVDMASVRDAERLTGYVEGGISPFGSYTPLPVYLEEALLEHDRVLINAGHRGLLVSLNPWDLQAILNAEVENISTV